MTELLASKVVIQEEAPKVRNIVGVPTSVGAFVGVTERGPLTRTPVSSYEEFLEVFGGLTANAVDLPIAVRGFFEESGGAAQKCYIDRVVHYSDITSAASKTSAAGTKTLLTDALASTAGSVTGTVAAPFALVDGDTLVASVDGGGNITSTFNATAAARENTPAETYALSDGQTLTVKVDGGSVQTITFLTAEFSNIALATAEEVAAVINAKITGASAAATSSGTKVTITSDTLGTSSEIEVTGGTANTALTFNTAAINGTGDAADASAVTVAELKTLFEADIAGITVTDVGGYVKVASNTLGGSSSILIVASSTLDTTLGLDNATHTGNAAGTLNTLQVDGKTDGAYANSVSVEIATATSGVTAEFNLLVYESSVLAEVFPNLSMDDTAANFVEDVVNAVNGGSDLITVTDLDAATSSPDDRPVNGTFALAGGDDGLTGLVDNDFIGSASSSTGLRAFDEVNDIGLLAIPGRATSAVQNAALTYAEVTRAKSMFVVLDPPASQTAAQIVTYVKTTAVLKESSEFGAMYWPRIKIDNPDQTLFGKDATIVAAPSGHICGVYARTDAAFGGAGVYEAPAGIEVGRIFAARGVETNEVNDENKRDLVYPELVNPIVSEEGQPTHIDGSRTLKSTGDFPTIGERRGVIFISKSLRTGLAFGKHRKIKPSTRSQLDRVTTRFMVTQTRLGAFASDDPTKAFFVDWSDALNPPSVAFGRKQIGRVGVATAKPSEFIIVKVSQDTRALDAELAAIAA